MTPPDDRRRVGDDDATRRFNAEDATRRFDQHGSGEDTTRHIPQQSDDETKMFPPQSGDYADEDFAQPEQHMSPLYDPRRDEQPAYQHPPSSGYVTQQQLLEQENAKMTHELEQLKEEHTQLSTEHETLEEESQNRQRTLWIALAVLAVLLFAALVYAFSQANRADGAESSFSTGEQSQEQLISDLERERDEANRRADDAQSQLEEANRRAGEEESRANDADGAVADRDRTIEDLNDEINERNEEIDELNERLRDAENNEAVTVTETVPAPPAENNGNNPDENNGGGGAGIGDIFSRPRE